MEPNNLILNCDAASIYSITIHTILFVSIDINNTFLFQQISPWSISFAQVSQIQFVAWVA